MAFALSIRIQRWRRQTLFLSSWIPERVMFVHVLVSQDSKLNVLSQIGAPGIGQCGHRGAWQKHWESEGLDVNANSGPLQLQNSVTWQHWVCFFNCKMGSKSLLQQDGRWEGGIQEGGDIRNPWLIHVDIWQKLTQYWKAIILQLKIHLK